MKWFKHLSNAHEDEFCSFVLDRFGLDGYARWWILLETIAAQMDETDRCWAQYPVTKWCSILRGKRKILHEFIMTAESMGKLTAVCIPHEQHEASHDSGLVSGSKREVTGKQSESNWKANGLLLKIEVKNLLKIRDNYTRNLQQSSNQEVEVEEEVEEKESLSTPKPTGPTGEDAGVDDAREREQMEFFEARFWKPFPQQAVIGMQGGKKGPKKAAFDKFRSMHREDIKAAVASVESYRRFLKASPDRPSMMATRYLNERFWESIPSPDTSLPGWFKTMQDNGYFGAKDKADDVIRCVRSLESEGLGDRNEQGETTWFVAWDAYCHVNENTPERFKSSFKNFMTPATVRQWSSFDDATIQSMKIKNDKERSEQGSMT